MPVLNSIKNVYERARKRLGFWDRVYKLGIYLFGKNPAIADRVRYSAYAVRTTTMIAGLGVFTGGVISSGSLILPRWAFWAFLMLSIINAAGIAFSMMGNHLRDKMMHDAIEQLQVTSNKGTKWQKKWRNQWKWQDKILKGFRSFSDVNGITGSLLTIASSMVESIVWLSLASRISSVISCLLILGISTVRFRILHNKLQRDLILNSYDEQDLLETTATLGGEQEIPLKLTVQKPIPAFALLENSPTTDQKSERETENYAANRTKKMSVDKSNETCFLPQEQTSQGLIIVAF
jgi:hypothetical protein